MRRAKETNWGYRLAERRDFLARTEILGVNIEADFDPTTDPALQGVTVKPDKDPIRHGYVFFHIIDPPLSQQHKTQLTIAIGKNGESPLRFWIRA